MDTPPGSSSGPPALGEGNLPTRHNLKRQASDNLETTGSVSTMTDKVPRKHGPATSKDDTDNIPLQNRFACLANIMDTNEDMDEDAGQGSLSTDTAASTTYSARDSQPSNQASGAQNAGSGLRTRKPPPVYLSANVKDYVGFSNQLRKSVGDNFYLKFLGKQIKIQFFKV